MIKYCISKSASSKAVRVVWRELGASYLEHFLTF